MCQKFRPDPQKRPNRPKFLPRRGQNGQKFHVKFFSKLRKKWNRGQIWYPGLLTASLRPNFVISKILGPAENSTPQGIFLDILTCGSKNFQKSPTSKIVQNHQFSTFVVFLLFFGQSCPSCPHLPNFASQKFLDAWRVSSENMYFW